MITKTIKAGDNVYDLDCRSETYEGVVALIVREIEKFTEMVIRPIDQDSTNLTRGRIDALKMLLKEIAPPKQ